MKGSTVVVIAGAGIALTSCSGKPARTPTVWRKPAFVRLFNLSGCDVKLLDRGRVMSQAPSSATATPFAPIKPGAVKFDVEGSCVKLHYSVDMEPATAGTLVLGPGGAGAWIANETRQPEAANFRVIYLDTKGAKLTSGPTIDLKGLTSTVHLTPGSKDQLLDTGSWQASSPSLSEPLSITVKDKEAYTLFVVKQPNGKLSCEFVDNSPVQKPISMGASGN